ncbi:MAG: hypothetical protein ACLQBX_01260 [Candidatus Limnocylindrales bacterium]
MSAPLDRLDACEVFAGTFAGNRNDCAEWTDGHWRRARRPLTAQVVHDAFASGRPLSFYTLDADSRAVCPAFDIDREDGEELGRRLLRRLHELGGVAYLERSRRGCHVSIPVDLPQPGILARRALRQLAREADVPEDPKVEVRPGQDKLWGADSVGSCLRAPTMPHPLTGKRYPLQTVDGRSLPLRIPDLMYAVDQCPASVILGLAERWQPPAVEATSAPRRSSDPGMSPIGRFNAEVGVCAVLVREFGCDPARTRPGQTIRCPGHPDAHPSLSITRPDDRAFCHAPSCELYADGRGVDAFDLWRIARQPAGAAA